MGISLWKKLSVMVHQGAGAYGLNERSVLNGQDGGPKRGSGVSGMFFMKTGRGERGLDLPVDVRIDKEREIQVAPVYQDIQISF